MTKQNKVYCIGDSHVSVFVGKDRLVPVFPEKESSYFNFFDICRLGPVTAYNFNQVKSTTNTRVLFEQVLKTVPLNAWIVVSAGEIDCRVHLLKQSEIQEKSPETVSNSIVKRYIEYLSEIKRMGYNICILLPPPTKYKIEDTPGYPSVGTEVERNIITRIFITALKRECDTYNIPYIGVFEEAITENFKTRTEFLWDGIHLSTIALPLLVKQLNAVSGLNFSIPLNWHILEIIRKIKRRFTK